MRPEEVLARRLAAEVESELSGLGALEAELAGTPPGDDTYALPARGSILHDFYNGIERVFVRIARELNGGVPRAEQWRRELIRNLALAIPAVRPAVIDVDLAGTLEEYLRLRHVFRNVHGAVLSAGRMRSLEARTPATLEAFRNQVRSFLAWMLGDECPARPTVLTSRKSSHRGFITRGRRAPGPAAILRINGPIPLDQGRVTMHRCWRE